jgi:hypothetical protein
VAGLLKRELELGSKVFFVCDHHDPDDLEFKIFPPHCIAGTPEAEVIPELARFRGEIIPKKRYSAFFGTPLEKKLRDLKPEKIIVEFINKKEHQLALASALSMSADRKTVCDRLHVEVGVSLPIVMDASFEKLAKTKDVVKVLEALNIMKFIERAKRNGTKSPLIVVAGGSITKAAANLPGVDVVTVKQLSVKDLAPGTHAGRLTLYTEGALPEIEKRFSA